MPGDRDVAKGDDKTRAGLDRFGIVGIMAFEAAGKVSICVAVESQILGRFDDHAHGASFEEVLGNLFEGDAMRFTRIDGPASALMVCKSDVRSGVGGEIHQFAQDGAVVEG